MDTMTPSPNVAAWQASASEPGSEPSEPTLSGQLRAIVVLLSMILFVVTAQFGYGLYRQAQIRHCTDVEASSAVQQAACLATH
ncbi:MAG TPA: hypothetical protein VHH53_06960 [Pseudonocardiaceae bacterium]|nr:hypothetical protein [Pseudonocardiaceae bacterium]